ncbi:MAG: hypothetical protein AAFR71_07265 [Pseudomonadota bacterium]
MMQAYQEMQEALVKNNPFAAMMPMAEEMQKTTQSMMGSFEFAKIPVTPVSSVSNLAAHPMAASAAGSAVTAGVASAALGTWFGWMTAAMDGAVKAQKATKGSSIFAPMSVDGVNPMKFDWGYGKSLPAPAFNFAKFEWFGEEVAAPAVKPKPAAKAKPKAATKPTAKTVAGAKPASAPKKVAEPAKSGAEPVVKAVEPAPKSAPVPAPKPAPVASVPAADVMPEDFSKPTAIAKPENVDDLKMIAGVGPKLEKVLNDLGIWTFAQVAGWTPNEIAWVDDYLQFKGRIDRDDWLAQADALATGGRDEYVKRFGKEPR